MCGRVHALDAVSVAPQQLALLLEAALATAGGDGHIHILSNGEQWARPLVGQELLADNEGAAWRAGTRDLVKDDVGAVVARDEARPGSKTSSTRVRVGAHTRNVTTPCSGQAPSLGLTRP